MSPRCASDTNCPCATIKWSSTSISSKPSACCSTIWRAVLSAGFELDRRSDVQGIYHRQVGLYADLLSGGQESGVFRLLHPARDIAMTLMSMEDYFGYRIAARDPDLSRTTALRLMRQYAELVVGVPLPEID